MEGLLSQSQSAGAGRFAQRMIDLENRLAMLELLHSSTVGGDSPGDIKGTIAAAAPSGWALVNGQTITGAQTAHPGFWSVIPAAWKSGANAVLPNWCGRTLIMAGTGAGLTARTLNDLLGEESHQLSTAELPVHSHANTLNDPTHAHGPGSSSNFLHDASGSPYYGVGNFTAGGGTYININKYSLTAYAATGISITNANAGSGNYHNNMQPSAVVNWVIKL